MYHEALDHYHEDPRSHESRDNYQEDGNLVPNTQCGFCSKATFQEEMQLL